MNNEDSSIYNDYIKKDSNFKLKHYHTGVYVACDFENFEKLHYKNNVEIKEAILEKKGIIFKELI